MDSKVLEKAKTLEENIKTLDKMTTVFDPKDCFVHLRVQDHYGNSGKLIKTYAFHQDESAALGGAVEREVAKFYGEFLTKARHAINKKKAQLEKELEKL
jgi:hypothetical protein